MLENPEKSWKIAVKLLEITGKNWKTGKIT
jgi:hypothetical protein